MADFHIWGRIEHTAPKEFFVIVSAVPESGEESVRVESSTKESLQAAQLELERLMVAMGAKLRANDHRVTDVE